MDTNSFTSDVDNFITQTIQDLQHFDTIFDVDKYKLKARAGFLYHLALYFGFCDISFVGPGAADDGPAQGGDDDGQDREGGHQRQIRRPLLHRGVRHRIRLVGLILSWR